MSDRAQFPAEVVRRVAREMAYRLVAKSACSEAAKQAFVRESLPHQIPAAETALAEYHAIIEERAGPGWMILGEWQSWTLAELLEKRDAD